MERAPFGGRILTPCCSLEEPPPPHMAKRLLAAPLCLALILATFSGTGWADDPRETPLVKAVKRARSVAVNIHSEKTEKISYSTDPAYASGTRRGRKINGMGTGIVLDERGYIVTNHHVVNGVDSLRVTLDDGVSYMAEVISEDPVRDLAVLKVRANKPLKVMPLGTSSDLMLGETVFAVGNAFGYEHTVTSGIISALHRDVEVNDTQSYKNLIQTDAAINPGNSGGPLINVKGEVIGINVAIRAGAQKIGFAIPIDDARKVIADLLKIEHFDGTFHGLATQDFKSSDERKLVVEGAAHGSPGDLAGLKRGDVILKAGDIDVLDGADLERALLGHNPGDDVRLSVRRGGEAKSLSLKLAAVSGEMLASGTGNIIVHVENDPLAQRLWDELGIRVAKIPHANPQLAKSKYDGGLQVVTIRPSSPAFRGGIQQRDVLVGLDRWSTMRVEDVAWILDHRQVDYTNPLKVKFHIVRSNETLHSSETLFNDMLLEPQTR
jgi:serine protease Do